MSRSDATPMTHTATATVLPSRIGAPPLWPRPRLRQEELALLTRQWATLIQAGLPMLQTLDGMARSHPHPVATQVLSDLARRLRQGEPLSRALQSHPKVFPDLYRHLVAAGEAAGMLDAMLLRLTQHIDSSVRLQRRIRAALLYPSVVLVVTVLVITVMMLFVVPAFEQLFGTLGSALPLATRLLVTSSRLALNHGGSLLLLLAVLSGLGLWVWRRLPAVQHWGQTVLLGLPLIGPLLQQAALARWIRTMATLSHSGLPLLEALRIAAPVTGWTRYRQPIESIARSVAAGIPLSEAMAATRLFPPLVLHMCAMGESSGTLDTLLDTSARMLEEAIDTQVSQLATLLEPLLVLLLGTVIGGVVAALYLPIFQMGQAF